MSKLNELTITEAAKKLRSKDFSVKELWDASVGEAKKRNPELNAYLEIFEPDDSAIAAAQRRIDADDAPPLCGIPLGMKDNILIEGKIASAASKMLENYRATYDATVTRKLREAGALFLGRTNMDEFAMGASTEHSAFGPVKNPHDTTRVPGGSSGGSTAAMAAHLGLGSYGTDTAGSCRQPAAYCGVVGFKPTYGAVSRHGIIALGSSLDQVGSIAKSVGDARLLNEAIAGYDPLDATSIPDGFYGTRTVKNGMRIGVAWDLLEGVQPDVLDRFKATLESLKAAGHSVVDVSLPTSKYAVPIYYVVLPAEASANLARYDGIRYGLAERGATLLDDYLETRAAGFGDEPKRRILLGTFVLSSGYIDAYYRKADAARALLTQEYNTAFERCDIVASPTTPAPAFKLGAKKDPVAMYLEDVFTVPANHTGMPAISVPMGNVERDGTMLPIGMHFVAPHSSENLLFDIGTQVEALY